MNCQPCSHLPAPESGLRLSPSLHAGPGLEFEYIQFLIRSRVGPSEPLGERVKRVFWMTSFLELLKKELKNPSE